MDSSLQLPSLTRLLTLNTEIHELRTTLMRQPLSGRIAELQDDIDLRQRASLATCWLTEGYDLEEDNDTEDADGSPGVG